MQYRLMLIFSILLQQILRHSRENSTKVIFLITDGYSNGGDPRPVAALLRDFGVEIFTFGIWQGNIRELNDMASIPKEEHCYLLHSFEEFEALARRALHEGNGSLMAHHSVFIWGFPSCLLLETHPLGKTIPSPMGSLLSMIGLCLLYITRCVELHK